MKHLKSLLLLICITACASPQPSHIVFVDSLSVGPALTDSTAASDALVENTTSEDDWNAYKSLQRRFRHFKGLEIDPDRETVYVQIARLLAPDAETVTDLFGDQSEHVFAEEGALENWLKDNKLSLKKAQNLSTTPGRTGTLERYEQRSYLAGVTYKKSSANDIALADHDIGYIKTGHKIFVTPEVLPGGDLLLKLRIELNQLADFIIRAVPDPMDPSRQIRLEVPIVARGTLDRELTFKGNEVIGIRCGPRAVILVGINVADSDVEIPKKEIPVKKVEAAKNIRTKKTETVND